MALWLLAGRGREPVYCLGFDPLPLSPTRVECLTFASPEPVTFPVTGRYRLPASWLPVECCYAEAGRCVSDRAYARVEREREGYSCD